MDSIYFINKINRFDRKTSKAQSIQHLECHRTQILPKKSFSDKRWTKILFQIPGGNKGSKGYSTPKNLSSFNLEIKENFQDKFIENSPNRKPNYLMKSMFSDKDSDRARTPSHLSFSNYSNVSPIFEYFDNSPIINKVKNEHMSFTGMINNPFKKTKKSKFNTNKLMDFHYEIEEEQEENSNNNNNNEEEEDNIQRLSYKNNCSISTKCNKCVEKVYWTYDNKIYQNRKGLEQDWTQENLSTTASKKPSQGVPMNVNININNNNYNSIYYNQNFTAFNPKDLQDGNGLFKQNVFANTVTIPHQVHFMVNNENNLFQFTNWMHTQHNNIKMKLNGKFNIPIISTANAVNNLYTKQSSFTESNWSFNSGDNNVNNAMAKTCSNACFNQNIMTLSDEELGKQAHIISKMQMGCRYLQKRIDKSPEIASRFFFQNVIQYFEELSTDQFGHYFLKKVLSTWSEDRLIQVIAIIFPWLPTIGTDQYGTRVLQDIIEHLSTDKLQASFNKLIIPQILNLIKDQNGSHIVHKLLTLPTHYGDQILEIIILNVKEISTNRKGCCFIQKCFEMWSHERLIKLLSSISCVLDTIINDQFGNYIIQAIFLFCDSSLKEGIYQLLQDKICTYSNQKFSSNVIEKCFDDDTFKPIMWGKLLIEDNFRNILFNSYGNYVIQKAINVANESLQNQFFDLLIPLVERLQTMNYGKKLLSKLLIQYPKLRLKMLY